MPPIYPPTLEQLKKMRKQAENAAAYTVVIDIDTCVISSVSNFLIWDDSNEILWAISENAQIGTQFNAPYIIRGYLYTDIESIECEYKN